VIVPIVRRRIQPGNVPGAVDVRLVDVDDDPVLGPAPRHGVAGQIRHPPPQLTVLGERGPAVHVQADQVPDEVHEQQARARILEDAAPARHDTVAAVFRPRQPVVVHSAADHRNIRARRHRQIAHCVRRLSHRPATLIERA
jgi:hypothetical protein